MVQQSGDARLMGPGVEFKHLAEVINIAILVRRNCIAHANEIKRVETHSSICFVNPKF